MVEPWPQRVRKWVCRHFGHREKRDEWTTWCGRCSVLIEGPLNGGGVIPPAAPSPDREGSDQ